LESTQKRIEAMFADSVAGRIEVWNTRYRKSNMREIWEHGEAWITIDGKRIYNIGDSRFWNQLKYEGFRLKRGSDCPDIIDLHQLPYPGAEWDEAFQIVTDQGIFSQEGFNASLFDYLNVSIDEAIRSDNPIIRAFAMLDRRFGKRRLMEFDDSEENPIVKTLYQFRSEAEGIDKTHNE
jgi:hypothetical protein